MHTKLVVKACSVLSCPTYVWTPLVFSDKVEKPVTKYDKMNWLEPVYMRIYFARKCQQNLFG